MAESSKEWDFVVGPRPLTLRIREWGEGDRVVVLLHGFLEQAAAFDDLAGAMLARGLRARIVAPDHRGHGLSGHVGAGGFYYFWDYVSDVDQLVEHLRGQSPGAVDLVGHSMGGTIASMYAALRPENVRRLVIAEGLGPPAWTESPIERARQFLAHQREPPRHKALASVEDGIARMRRFNPGLREEVARRLVERATRPWSPGDPQVDPTSTGSLVWTWDALHRSRSPTPSTRAQYEAVLRAIVAPTLVVYAERSLYADISEVAAREAALADLRKAVIPGAGHLVHTDRPDALAEAILGHLE